MISESLHPSAFKSINEDLACSLCTNIPLAPVLSDCQRLYCPSCIEAWQKDVGTCPSCDRNLPGHVGKLTRIIASIHGQLETFCENRERGCEEWVKLSSRGDHFAVCGKAPVMCSNAGCEVVVNRNAVQHHEAKCDHRRVLCDLCTVPVSLALLPAHKETQCPQGMVECCGQKMRRADLDLHAKTCRDRQLVSCPLGCGKSVPHGELEAHVASNLLMHLHLVTVERGSSLHSLQSEVHRLKQTTEALTKEMTKAKAVLQQLQNERREAAWYGMGGWRQEPDGRCLWSVGNLNQRLKEASMKQQAVGPLHIMLPELIWSPHFYTHQSGYRFSLRLDLGSAPSVGLFIHLHQGDNDDNLHWPFNLDYTVQIGSVVSTIMQRDSFMLYSSMGRPPHDYSWGWANFCSITAFKEAIVGDTVDVSIYFHASTQSAPPPRLPSHPEKQYNGGAFC
eukprot:TRINITY_DN14338_c0_g1_i1.p1 TRINITY_DN14338_c0_g1~~TRINITY_DN14338_c0_g1_i1.p1  ORF type:complete len:449 (-),score=59.00 TRINITY_DN14338_c0_g1_i1:30-1376(-)